MPLFPASDREPDPQLRDQSAAINQQLLLAKSQMLEATLDSSLDMIQVLKAVRDESGSIVDFVWVLNNHASEQYYGDVIGKSLLTLNPGVVEEGIFDTFKRVVETGVADQSERHYVHEQFNGWYYQSTVKLEDGVATTTTNITQRKLAEQEILRLKDDMANHAMSQYLTLFNSMDQGFCVIEVLFDDADQPVDYRFLEMNPAFIKQIRLQCKPGDTMRQWVPETEAYWFEIYGEVARTGVARRFEQFASQLGNGLWYEVYAFPLEGGTHDRVGILFNDITQRRQTDETLRLSEQRTRLAIDAAEMATWEWDLVTNRVYWNDRHFHALGIPVEDGPTRINLFMQHLHPDDTEMVQSQLERMIRERTLYDAEYRIVREDGTVRWMSGYGGVTAEHQGRAVTASGVMFDITDRKKAEEALRQSEQRKAFLLRFSDALRPITDPLIIQDEAARVLGEFLGADRVGYAHAKDEDQLVAVDRHYVNGVPEISGVYRYADYGPELLIQMQQGKTVVRPDIANDPSLTDAEKYAHLVLGLGATVNVPLVKQGRLMAILFVHFTNAHFWSAEELNIIEETAERTWAAVEMAKVEESLRQANRRKDEFLAMLAHELRNPMATIRSGLGILSLTASGESVRPTLEMMGRQTEHLVRMVDDLLDMSRITSGKIELKTQRVDLTELVRQAVQAVKPTFDQHHKQVFTMLPSAPVELEGDATRLVQVINNLLTNAIRYTGERGTAWIHLSRRDALAVIEIKDDGIGLAPDQLTAIFELFVQGDNSLARSQGGLGVGLTLVRQLVDMHGGRVYARSEGLGKGSCFTVELPALEAAPQPGPATQPGERSGAAQPVLIVDDDPDAAITTMMLLKLRGYNAHKATSGPECLQLLDTLKPRVIILDIGMPGMDGYQTCTRIRERQPGSDLTVVALSGYGKQQDIDRSIQSGFDAHLVKPIDIQALTGVLDELLARP